MADREKVIKGLECCLGASDCDIYPKEECPYNGMALCAMCLKYDVMELLKAQEPKRVRCVRRLTRVMKGVCPACELEIESVCAGIRITKFCKFCGQAVKWDV